MLPQGPSLRSGLFCPGPSSLIRPHPPHSQAHHDFIAVRLIRGVFAGPSFGLRDPRVVPCFRCWSFVACRPLRPRSTHRQLAPSVLTDGSGLRPPDTGSAYPIPPPSVSSGIALSRLHGSRSLRPVTLLASLTDLTGNVPANGDFYARASSESVTLLTAGYDYGGH